MKCPRCQHENLPSMRFCGECGARLAAGCSACGAPNAPTQKFCGECGALLTSGGPKFAAPESYTPKHLAEKILTSKSALEGERKQVTVLFADLKGSMELLADRDPEEARKLLDPVLERMMEAVHRYEGTVNQVMGDGIMALFGAPLAHEDHAVRACYAALRMQDSVKRYAEVARGPRAYGGSEQVTSVTVASRPVSSTKRSGVYNWPPNGRRCGPGRTVRSSSVLVTRPSWRPYGLELAFGWLVLALGEIGAFEEGIALGCESLQLETIRDRPVPHSMLLIGLGELYCSRGDFAAASDALERALALVRRYELHTSAFPVLRTLGYAYAMGGRAAHGRGLLEEAFAIAESLSHRRPHATRVLEKLGRVCLIDGKPEEAREYAVRALTRARERGERSIEAYAVRLLADVEAQANSTESEVAALHYREAIALGTELGMRPLVARCYRGLGELLRRFGRKAPADRCAALAATLAAEMRLCDLVEDSTSAPTRERPPHLSGS